MQHISTTPFGRRPIDSALMAARQMAECPVPDRSVDKYQILTALTQARAAFQVTDRDLAVLSALISFHHDRRLEGADLIVFPSNAALSARAHGMAESTLRRHLRALVQAGLILRHDSPNGKRYATRAAPDGSRLAFGFDLRPLILRADEIFAAAIAAQEAAEALRRLRERVVLQLRDARKLVEYAQDSLRGQFDALEDRIRLTARSLRRKLNHADLTDLAEVAKGLLKEANALFPKDNTEDLHGNDLQNERHIQYSNPTLTESEPSKKMEDGAADPIPSPSDPEAPPPQLPLGLVLKAVPDLRDYAPDGIKDWHQFIVTVAFVRGMLGINEHAWAEACRIMGDAQAAITVACILQRAEHIAKPGGYLRSLSARAAEGRFSTGPMVMALLRAENTKPA